MNRSLAAAASRDGPAQLAAALAGVEASLGLAAALDDLGELALLRGVQQRHLADLVEVQANRITHVATSNLL